MKYFLIGLIKIYQMTPTIWHSSCRFQPTCSNYAIEAIGRFGSIKGSLLTIKRILKCHPHGPSGYDPVPSLKEKNL